MTLLELLVVVSILGVIAGGVIVAFGSVEETASAQIARAEIAAIKRAVLRFHRDTGFLPGQGPFELESAGGAVRRGNLPVFDPSNPPGLAWLHSPANFWQLFENPLWDSVVAAADQHPLARWDPVTRRGWNGPYLELAGNGLVHVGSGVSSRGQGDPGVGARIAGVYGVADPFDLPPTRSGLLKWGTHEWSAVDEVGTDRFSHERWGRPYLMFDLDDRSLARIVSSGPDGVYHGADPRLFLRPGQRSPIASDGSDDDIVIYLFR